MTADYEDDIHVVLGLTEEEHIRLLGDPLTGVPISKDPHYHAHPVLGIEGHLHRDGRTRHAHYPKWEWDMTPIPLRPA